MSHRFHGQVKSTLERLCTEIATAVGVQTLDIDSLVNVEDDITGKGSRLLFELLRIDPAPVDPLYDLTISVGAKTSDDPGGYKLLEIQGALAAALQPRQAFDLFDLTSTEATATTAPRVGFAVVNKATSFAQQASDRSGVRMMTVTLNVQRLEDDPLPIKASYFSDLVAKATGA